ncbi:unnamed protein product [Rotaria magnacalcarata]|uniref:Uncharacterized protein n=1 Tax=Rotaria magnacalcarata TaxID=392030 RepID=A0A8S3G350_9BILA|nr:unnamed protein product [Rotaria magnacalcarata]
MTVDAHGQEDSHGNYFSPPECPTTSQVTDRWFYGGENFPIRPLNELIDGYHTCVPRTIIPIVGTSILKGLKRL